MVAAVGAGTGVTGASTIWIIGIVSPGGGRRQLATTVGVVLRHAWCYTTAAIVRVVAVARRNRTALRIVWSSVVLASVW